MDNTTPGEGLTRQKAGVLSQRLKELSQGLGSPPRDITRQAKSLLSEPESPAATLSGTVWALIDTSSSMEGGPLPQAKPGLERFCRDAVDIGYRVGVIAFDSSPREVSPATDDIKRIASRLRALEASGGTAMAQPIRMAIDRLKTGQPERVIFLVTDGQPSDPEDTLTAADEARRGGIDLLTLGTETADHDFLRRIATRTTLARQVVQGNLELGIAETARLLLKSPE